MISVLLPVYNVEKFLKLALDSVFNQSYEDFEVVVVDDGSTDGSLKILREYAKGRKNMQVFHRENAGYGATLNFAIRRARGEYVAILEPDDFWHRDFLGTMVKGMRKYKVEVGKCSFYKYFGKTGKIESERVFHFVRGENLERGVVLEPRKQQQMFFTDPSVWSGVYRKDFLERNKIWFTETPGASYQDTAFCYKVFARAEKMFCLEQPLYYYRQDNENASVKSTGKIYAVGEEYDSVDEYIGGATELSSACRFHAYVWNMNRLKFRAAWEFAWVVREDYARLRTETGFSAGYYVEKKMPRGHELKFAVRHPKMYVVLRPAFAGYNGLKGFVYKIVKKRNDEKRGR